MEEHNTHDSSSQSSTNTNANNTPHTTPSTVSMDDVRIPAALSYLFFLIPWLFSKQDDTFVRFHINQAFGLFIIALITQFVISFVFSPMFYYGFGFFMWILQLAYILLAIKGALNAWAHKEEPLPFIGTYLPVVFK